MTERETKIADLLERVKAATGPDRELDANLWEALVPGVSRKKWSYVHEASGKLCEVDETRDETRRLITVPAYTGSIDAALALVERVLPGVFWRIERTLPSHWHTTSFWATCGRRGEQEEGHGATPALAILAALLTALSAPEKAGEVET